jgi:hypothetical protein
MAAGRTELGATEAIEEEEGGREEHSPMCAAGEDARARETAAREGTQRRTGTATNGDSGGRRTARTNLRRVRKRLRAGFLGRAEQRAAAGCGEDAAAGKGTTTPVDDSNRTQ